MSHAPTDQTRMDHAPQPRPTGQQARQAQPASPAQPSRLTRLKQRLARAGTLWVTLGNAAGAGLGFVVLILLTRSLGAEGYAAIAPALAVMDLGQLLIDTLLAAGVVTVAARALGQSAQGHAASGEGASAMKTGLVLRSLGGLGFAALFWLLAPILAPYLGADASAVPLIRFAGIAGGLLAVQSALLAGLQITQGFRRLAIGAIFKNLARVLVLAAALTAGITAAPALVGLLLGAGVVALLATLLLARPGYARAPFSRPHAAQMLSINKWMMLASVAIVSGRIDILLLASLSTEAQTAYYAAAMQLCIAIGIISQALVTTTLPRAAQYTRREEMRGFLRAWIAKTPLALLPVLALPLVSPWVFPAILGPSFSGGHMVLNLLFASSMITLIANPALVLLFPLGSARIFGLAALGQVLAKWTIGLMLLEDMGAAGLALADIVTKLAVTALIFASLARQLRGTGPLPGLTTPAQPAPDGANRPATASNAAAPNLTATNSAASNSPSSSPERSRP